MTPSKPKSRFDEKINDLAFDKFKAEYKLKTREEEKELKKRMDEVQMMDSFARKKRLAIEEELKKAQGGGATPTAAANAP